MKKDKVTLSGNEIQSGSSESVSAADQTQTSPTKGKNVFLLSVRSPSNYPRPTHFITEFMLKSSSSGGLIRPTAFVWTAQTCF